MRFENNNRQVVRRLTIRFLKKNKLRNTIAIIAILLTTFMISSVFSLGVSFIKNYRIMNLRLQGNTATAVLSNPTEKQMEQIKALQLMDSIGYEIDAGRIALDSLAKNRLGIQLKYCSDEDFQKQMAPCISDIKGAYPTSENQVMASQKALEFLGKGNAKIGDSLEVPCSINGSTAIEKFILSGYYTTYGIGQSMGYFLVSRDFIQKRHLSLQQSGLLLMTVKQEYQKNAADKLLIPVHKNQELNFRNNNTTDSASAATFTILLILIIALFIVLNGYLLIYNILYISVAGDIRFYGLLKTIGTSPRQIKKIVRGQALGLSLIGIPIGLLLGAAASLLLVPFVFDTLISTTGNNGMPGDISFHPGIFLTAALFALVTVVISCRKPAKIAGNISPVEALRYTGSKHKKQSKTRNTTKGGKLFKMAWHNVFRDRKRAVVVFLSLFMGIMTFLSVNTFLSSLTTENYINQNIQNDFDLQNPDVGVKKIDAKMIDQIKNLKGFQHMRIATSSKNAIEMNEQILLPALQQGFKRSGLTKQDLEAFLKRVKHNPLLLSASVIGIDAELLTSINREEKEKIDIDAFKAGRLILVDSWYYGKDFHAIKGQLKLKNPKSNAMTSCEVCVIRDGKGLLPPGLPAPLGVPTIYMNTPVLKRLDKGLNNYMVSIDVDSSTEGQAKAELKNIVKNTGLWLDSRSDRAEEFRSAKMAMNILGGGISLILILIGLLNFINVMLTGVNARRKELAIMESIGMTKRQMKTMLTVEGLYYAGITALFTATVGMAIIYGITELTKHIADYAVFVFPAATLAVLAISIFSICALTPRLAYRQASKSSVVDRIRELES